MSHWLYTHIFTGEEFRRHLAVPVRLPSPLPSAVEVYTRYVNFRVYPGPRVHNVPHDKKLPPEYVSFIIGTDDVSILNFVMSDQRVHVPLSHVVNY